MQASEIDSERFGGKFPDSRKIEAGDEIDLVSFAPFTTPKGLKGVSLVDREGKHYHTTTKQPVGYILSTDVGLDNLIKKSPDGCVRIYFSNEKPKDSRFDTMLKCSVYKSRG